MHCVAAVHGPVAPSVTVTALDAAPDGTTWSGAADGTIACWRQQQQAGDAAVQPVAVLQGHSHQVVALLSGLRAGTDDTSIRSSNGPSYLLSLDAEGWVGLWDCSSWVCLDMTRAAPLPPACTPSLLLMPDGDHVCIVIPATPNLQQEQQTLWQHQRQHQQQHQQPAHRSTTTSAQQQHQHAYTGPATAANLSPMMLVLRWRSLALVAAPLVSNLGLLALTSSSITLDQADAVVASAVINTAPALAPTAADTVVLAVMRSGWMWAGSLAGSSLNQAWKQPLVAGGSSAPLRHSCLAATSSSGNNKMYRSSAGGSSSPEPGQRSAGLQLQLLLVQPDGWRLFACSSFSSSDGMPQEWVQLAQQLQGPSRSRLHVHGAGSCQQHETAGTSASAAAAVGRVRFDLNSSKAGAEGYSGSGSSCSSTSSSSSTESESGSADEGVEAEEGEGGGDGVLGRVGSRLRQGSGPGRRQRRRQQQGLQLLGGTLLQLALSGAEPWQHQAGQGAIAAVVVWSECGEQQLWGVLQEQGSIMMQQQQQPVLVQCLQMHPWPAQAAGKVFAAANRSHGSLSLLTQHSLHLRHHHHHHYQHSHHQQYYQDPSSSSSASSVEWLLSDAPHKWRSDWHLHCTQLAADSPLQLSQQQPGQQRQRASSLTPEQHLPWRLKHCQGAYGAAWHRHDLYHTCSSTNDSSSSSASHDSCSVADQQQQGEPDRSSCSGAGLDAMQVDQNDHMVSSSSRKRPAAEAPIAESVVVQGSAGQVMCGPERGRAKQPRVQGAGLHSGQQTEAEQAAAAFLDGQHQQVTHMLLLGSDAPVLHQVAVFLDSGTILFYDLATYCVPGAAWHPDCCVVGSGHVGRVSTTLEVTFKCPPQHLLCCAGAPETTAWTSTHGGLQRPVNWHFSSTAAGRADSSARGSHDGGWTSGADGSSSSRAVQDRCYEAVPECPAAAQGWCRRPAQGGVVPLLLTGGRDGSLRAWDLRLQHLGQPWMVVHPHTAPVEAIVLPPVSARLPWSTCVLSVCASGRVALSCLASGTIKRTFDGWDLGPPAQLAWSTGRGLLAAGGWDVAGVWQVAVWDTYSGAMDRQLQGAAAHMLMASLAQELTSSMRHLSRAQAQQHTAPAPAPAPATAAGTASSGQLLRSVAAAAGTGMGAAGNVYWQYQVGSSIGGKRDSFDAAHSGSQAASGDGAKVSSSSGVGDASGFTPRLQLVTHAGPLRPVPCGKQDVLLVDVDVQQLVQQLELCAKQQKRESSRQQQQHTGSPRRSSMDVDSSTASARASRASSLDLLGLVQGGVVGTDVLGPGPSPAVPSSTSPQQQQHMEPGAAQYQQQQTPRAPAAAATGPMHVLHSAAAAAAAMSRQGSLASAAGAAVDRASTQPAGARSQQRRVHGRAAMAPAVAAALQVLCLLHKWGLEPKLDQQLLLLLEQLQGFSAAAAGELLTQSSSTSLPLSPRAPITPAAAVSAAAPPAADAAHWVDALQANVAAGQQVQLLAQLQVLLSGPAACSPVLQPGAPCLSQELLLSPNCHAAVIALPSAHSSNNSNSMRSSDSIRQQQQQQQQVQAGRTSVDNQQSRVASHDSTAAAAATKPHALLNKPPCLLLATCPTLLSCRLLTLVAVSKWLMATIPSHTSVTTCSGLVTLYALHSTELITQAAAAAAAAAEELCSTSGPLAAASSSRSGGRTSPIQPHPKQQQQQQERQLGYAGQASVLPDLLLIASTSLACPGLLAEAAQLLLAALLQPSPPGTYLPPTLSLKHTMPQQLAGAGTEQQQHEEVTQQVFTSPGAAAAASCWPPAVLQLAVQYAQQQQPDTSPQGNSPTNGSTTAAAGTAFSLHQLPLWLPQLVLAGAAAVAHPTRMPPELLAAVSAGLLDVLLGGAPAHSSCVAASWLCQVLRGGHWALWRPYLGKPGHLAQRLCHLVDRLQASSTDSRTAASHLVSQSLSNSTCPHPTTAHSNSSSGTKLVTTTSGSSTGFSGDFVLLSQQPYAVADPVSPVGIISRGLSSSSSNEKTASSSSSSSSGWGKWRPQHVEGGLFLSSALMGSAAAASQRSWTPGGVSRSASPAAGAVAGLLEVSPVGRVVPAGGGGALGSSGWIGSGTGVVHGSQLQAGLLDLHSSSSGVTYSYSGTQHSPSSSGVGAAGSSVGSTSSGVKHGQAGGLSSISEQQQQVLGARVSRGVLVVWLRAALDVLAALAHVDPAAVLMELSHRLAAPGAESSGTSLTLLIASLSRLLKRTSERPALLPHLGFITALAAQALDPGRPLLRHTLLQPVMGVVKDLTGHFPQADCHSSSLQVAVGSTRALAGPSSGASGAAAGRGASSSWVQVATVAVFDLNGGTKNKVLLLPVLMDEPDHQQQQQQQGSLHASPAGPGHGPGGPSGSTGSLHSTIGSTPEPASAVLIPQGLHHQTAAAAAAAGGALPGLWSSAEGVPGVPAAAKGSGGWGGMLAGGSSSSLSSSSAFDTPADSRSGSNSRLGELQRGVLASSTMTRAEAAMVEGWFGGSPSSSADGAAGVPNATLRPAPDHADVSAAAGASGGGMPRPQQPRAMQCGVIYPDAASASSPVLCASEVSEGVAAVAFSPGGDAVAAFVLGCHCLVVWRLGASWTQKLAHLGSSRPMNQMPHAYIRLPQAALLVHAVFEDGAAGRKQQHSHRQHHHHHHHHGQRGSEGGEGACVEVLQWQLKWQTDSHIDLLYQGCLCGSVEVHL